MTNDQQRALWEAIDEYVLACGGDPARGSADTVGKLVNRGAVARELDAIEAPATASEPEYVDAVRRRVYQANVLEDVVVLARRHGCTCGELVSEEGLAMAPLCLSCGVLNLIEPEEPNGREV